MNVPTTRSENLRWLKLEQFKCNHGSNYMFNKNNKLLSKILPFSKKNKDLEKLRSKFKQRLAEQVTVDEITRIEQRSLYLESIK
ncbi:predicted protein [Rickettsia japonica]|uniref:Uncharacterized protein n=7 Tax=spotted fever group TaxID=114277 RepID=G4KMC5_RICJY|nr:unknown [Rickettsia conorii str. Malish 7]BAK96433.1 hypothetical protein RJP_0212 [Rickettsia japonica YH]BAW82495.1 predicted protein [Rickettsia japonica]